MKPGITWPLIIFGFLGLSVGMNVYLIYMASTDDSFAVEKDYYRKAVEWDETQAERARSKALGWTARLETGPAFLRIELRDQAGQPIEDAWVEVEAFPNVRADEIVTGQMKAIGPGAYELKGAFQPAGIWEVRLRVEVEEDRFVKTFQSEILPPQGALGTQAPVKS